MPLFKAGGDKRGKPKPFGRMQSVPENTKSSEEFSDGRDSGGSAYSFDPTNALIAPHLSWKDLTVESISTFTRTRSEILKGISGRLKPHRLTCVLGPSGAGKSTLMNVLSGRIADSYSMSVKGRIECGDKRINYVDLRDRIAYVMQHDCLLPTDTAKESILFGAIMRGVPNPEERTDKIMK